jgi:hypothetical protein
MFLAMLGGAVAGAQYSSREQGPLQKCDYRDAETIGHLT